MALPGPVVAPDANVSLRCAGRLRGMSFALYRVGVAAPLQYRDSAEPWADFPLPGARAPGTYSCYYHTPSSPYVLSLRSEPLVISADGKGRAPGRSPCSLAGESGLRCLPAPQSRDPGPQPLPTPPARSPGPLFLPTPQPRDPAPPPCPLLPSQGIQASGSSLLPNPGVWDLVPPCSLSQVSGFPASPCSPAQGSRPLIPPCSPV